MKGEKTITVNGKEYPLRFTAGALREFQDHLEEVGYDAPIDQALSKMKYLFVLLSKMTKYGGNEIDPKEFDWMDMSEINSAMEMMGESTKDLPDSGKVQKGK